MYPKFQPNSTQNSKAIPETGRGVLNYLYSIYRRAHDHKEIKEISFHRGRASFCLGMLGLLYVIPSLIGSRLFPDIERYFQMLGCILFAFGIVWPVIHIFYPGYIYLESVRSYSKSRAVIVMILIQIMPWILIYYWIRITF